MNRRIKNIIICLIALPCFFTLFSGCSNKEEPSADDTQTESKQPEQDKKIKVGFSQMENDNPWRICETNSVLSEAAIRGYEVVYRDAESQVFRQIEDVEYMISQGVDIILLAPRQYEEARQALVLAREAGVPVILLDRTVRGEPGVDYVTNIMGNFIEVGSRACKIIAEKYEGRRCNVVELRGTEGASCAIELSEGFRREMENHPNMRIIASESGDFNRSDAQKVIETIIQTYGSEIDAVFGHSDEEGIAAIQAFKAVGIKPNEDVFIVTMCGMKDALKAIVGGELLASIECSPRLGPIAFDTVEAYFRGDDIPVYIEMPGKTYDITNAEELMSEGY